MLSRYSHICPVFLIMLNESGSNTPLCANTSNNKPVICTLVPWCPTSGAAFDTPNTLSAHCRDGPIGSMCGVRHVPPRDESHDCSVTHLRVRNVSCNRTSAEVVLALPRSPFPPKAAQCHICCEPVLLVVCGSPSLEQPATPHSCVGQHTPQAPARLRAAMASRQIDLPPTLDVDMLGGLVEPAGPGAPMASAAEPRGQEMPLAGEANALVVAGGARQFQPQIEIDSALVDLPQAGPAARLPPRSAATAANARLHRSLNIARAKSAAAVEKSNQLQNVLSGVVTLLPGAAQLVGNVKATVIGRLKASTLKPFHFALISRAAFMPAKAAVQVGIKMKRLLAAATRAMQFRQEIGLARLLSGAEIALAAVGPGEDIRTAHLSYTHLWDEVNCKFIWNMDSRYRRGRAGIHVQTLVQRGCVSCTVASAQASAWRTFREVWLVQPKKVSGTSAEALWPALLQSLPKACNLMDTEQMEKLSKMVSSFSVQFVCDKASGNLLVLKTLGKYYEEFLCPLTNGKLLLWPETCTVHLHHRCKLQVRALRTHTMRHFSLANLVRLVGLRSHMLRWLEEQVPSMFARRVVGPRPTDMPGDLGKFIDILYKPSDPYHDRKKGRKSQRSNDLAFLKEMLNGNVLGVWEHYCFDPQSGKPCCESLSESREKTVRAVINFFQGEAEPIPAEARWTHTLSNFKKTLMRKAIYSMGVKCFPGGASGWEDGLVAQIQDVDGQAMEDYADNLNKTRLSKTLAYFNDTSTFPELAILTLVLDTVDTHLLYPMLGDPALQDDGQPSKVDVLLDPEDSSLGKCAQRLLLLLDTWTTGGCARDPWCVFDMVGGDPHDAKHMLFARSQILRMNSSFGRRYLTRYSTWPYLLYPLCSEKFDMEEKKALAEKFLAESEPQLDVYSRGIRRLFGSVEELLSVRCRAALAADFRSQALSTCIIERLNAEITATAPRRAPARSFATASRESFLRQAAVVHRGNGGMDPVGKATLAMEARQEIVRACPLLPLPSPSSDSDARRSVSARDAQVAPLVRSEALRANAIVPGGAGADLGGAIIPQAALFGEVVEVTRDIPSCLPRVSTEGAKDLRRGAGLSPYMLELNKTMAAARSAKGKALTHEEMTRIRAEFKEQWQSMGDHNVFAELYTDWRAKGKSQRPEVKNTYKLMWGGGCSITPLTAEEFWSWHQQFGWPSDAEVFDEGGDEILVKPDKEQTFNERFPLWGVGRAARNIDRATTPSPAQFNVIESGLNNFVQSLTKPVADSGAVMVIIEGPSLSASGAPMRCASLVTGTSYSPKVFDITPCEAEIGGRFHPVSLAMPYLVTITSGPCRAAPGFVGIGYETSDEFILALVRNFSSMVLFRARYDIIQTGDGTLRWSRIQTIDRIGTLWEPGMTRPMLAEKVKARGSGKPEVALKRLRTGDPFEPGQQPSSSGQARGSARRGRGAARRHEVPSEPRGAPRAPLVDDAAGSAELTSDMAVDLGRGIGEESERTQGALQEEMDIAEAEDLLSDDSTMSELFATYGAAAEDDPSCLGRVGGIADDFQDDLPDAEQDGLIATQVAEELSKAAAEVGLEGDLLASSASSTDPPTMVEDGEGQAAPEAATPALAELTDPSSLGYMYLNGRSIARVQYGKPKKSVTINCYRHPGCRLLLSESRCPDLSELKRWVFAVEAPEPGATQQDKKELAKQHMALGRESWFANKGR